MQSHLNQYYGDNVELTHKTCIDITTHIYKK